MSSHKPSVFYMYSSGVCTVVLVRSIYRTVLVDTYLYPVRIIAAVFIQVLPNLVDSYYVVDRMKGSLTQAR